MYTPNVEALMKTIPPAQAEHHLIHVANRFDHWRQTRTTPADPIPPSLWEHAIAFTTTFSIARVTRLRVSGGEVKKRRAARHAARVAPVSTAPPGFVDVPAAPAWPLPTSGIEIELHRPEGARLRIAAHESQIPLTAVVRTFLETLA
jgi:hypothetical protein